MLCWQDRSQRLVLGISSALMLFGAVVGSTTAVGQDVSITVGQSHGFTSTRWITGVAIAPDDGTVVSYDWDQATNIVTVTGVGAGTVTVYIFYQNWGGGTDWSSDTVTVTNGNPCPDPCPDPCPPPCPDPGPGPDPCPDPCPPPCPDPGPGPDPCPGPSACDTAPAPAPLDDKLKPGDPIPGTEILILSVIPGPPVQVILLGPDGGLYGVTVPGSVTIDGVTIVIAEDGSVFIVIPLPYPFMPIFVPAGTIDLGSGGPGGPGNPGNPE